MAKLKNSFSNPNSRKVPVSFTENSLSKAKVPRDLTEHIVSLTRTALAPHALSFGTPHTRSSATASGSGSSWTGLLNSATGGASGILSGGLLSSSGFGLVTRLLNLFGGGKSTPAAPATFHLPSSQNRSLNIAVPGLATSVDRGVQPITNSNQLPVTHNTADQHLQTAHVIQIVRQALLTSSSLNDVIAEI